MKKLFFIGCCLLIAGCPAWAGAGATGGNFLLMGGGARPLAMGEAYVALADDASSVFWNPAGLARMNFPELQYMYNEWFIDIKHQYFGFAYPTENGTFAGSYSLLDSGDIQGYDASGSREAVFKAQDNSMIFSWGRKLSERLSVGVNLKTLSESLENYQATSTALDAGLLFDLTPKLRFGAAVQNIGTALKFITEESPLPLTYRVGLGMRNRFFGSDVMSLGIDYVNNSNASTINAGGEYLFRDLLALRVGALKGALRAGVGLKTSNYALDYAYLSHSDLGATHQVSVSYSFGSEDTKKAEILEYMTFGKAYYDKGRFPEAVVEFQKVLSLDPEHAEGRALLTKSRRALEGGAVEEVKEEIRAEKETEANIYIEAGKKFMAEKQHLEAIAEFNKAMRILPSHPETIKLIREAQYALETEVTERVKEEAREHLGMALKYIATENYAEALQEVGEVLKIDPGNVEALKLYKKLKKLLEIEKE